MEKYMAYNHNRVPLMKEAASKQAAEKEAAEYSHVTGNGAYVESVAEGEIAKPLELPAVAASGRVGIWAELENALKQMTADEIGRWFIDYMLESSHQGFDGFSARDMTGIRNLVRDMLLHKTATLADDPQHFQKPWFSGSHTW